MAAPVGPKKVHRYTLEFKIQAVRLSLHPDIETQVRFLARGGTGMINCHTLEVCHEQCQSCHHH